MDHIDPLVSTTSQSHSQSFINRDVYLVVQGLFWRFILFEREFKLQLNHESSSKKK